LAGKVTAGLAESNGSLQPGGWLQVTYGLTACTPGSAPGPMLGNEYGRTLPFYFWKAFAAAQKVYSRNHSFPILML